MKKNRNKFDNKWIKVDGINQSLNQFFIASSSRAAAVQRTHIAYDDGVQLADKRLQQAQVRNATDIRRQGDYVTTKTTQRTRDAPAFGHARYQESSCTPISDPHSKFEHSHCVTETGWRDQTE